VPWTDGTTTLRTICYGKQLLSGYLRRLSEANIEKQNEQNVIKVTLENIGFNTSKRREYDGECHYRSEISENIS